LSTACIAVSEAFRYIFWGDRHHGGSAQSGKSRAENYTPVPVLVDLEHARDEIAHSFRFSARIGRRVLGGNDWKGLLKLIDEVRARVSREMGRTVEVMSCYEAMRMPQIDATPAATLLLSR
jgi:hypothetical protein